MKHIFELTLEEDVMNDGYMVCINGVQTSADLDEQIKSFLIENVFKEDLK